MVVYLT